MKNVFKAVLMFSVVAFAAVSFAGPKCSHRLASGSNDMFKNTNPVKERVAKTTTSSGGETTKSGVK